MSIGTAMATAGTANSTVDCKGWGSPRPCVRALCGRREDVRRLCRRHPRSDRRAILARSGRPRSSSPPWAPPATPTPWRPGPKQLPNWIGSHSRAFAYFGGDGGASRAGQSQVRRRQCLSVRSRDQPHLCRQSGAITTPRSCRHGRANRGTKRKWKSASRSSSAGFWPACAIAVSSASPN